MKEQLEHVINTYFYQRLNAINPSTIGLSPDNRYPGERDIQICDPYLSFSGKVMIYFMEDFLRACECRIKGPGAIESCKELDWDPKAETVSCKQTTSYVCKYYGQRFALGSGVWKMEPKIEGHYCTNIFKFTQNLAASCHQTFAFIIINNVVIVDYWNPNMV